VNEFYALLEDIGIVNESSMSPQHYGLGLAIGNVDVSLYRLVQAYTTLAREGLYSPLRLVAEKKDKEVRIFVPETAYAIHNILADASARLLTFGNPAFLDFGFPVAVKTGTSSNYRDCWIIAYTSRHVVGLWAGNFDGRPTNGGAGATVLGPILKEIMEHLYSAGEPEPFLKPPGIREASICWLSGKAASPQCPHVTRELVLPASSVPPACSLSHKSDQNYYLGSQYAQWVHHREIQLGRGRFRLMTPEAALSNSASTYTNSSLSGPIHTAKTSAIEIVSPHESDRFILSPHNSSRVLFRAVPQPVVDHVVWLLDGVEIAKTPAPYEFVWDLVRGKHTLHAVTPGREAAQVSFQVE
jgi:penicillin-binding protein 1C